MVEEKDASRSPPRLFPSSMHLSRIGDKARHARKEASVGILIPLYASRSRVRANGSLDRSITFVAGLFTGAVIFSPALRPSTRRLLQCHHSTSASNACSSRICGWSYASVPFSTPILPTPICESNLNNCLIPECMQLGGAPVGRPGKLACGVSDRSLQRSSAPPSTGSEWGAPAVSSPPELSLSSLFSTTGIPP